MSTGPAGGGYHTSEDEKILHRLGYAQELFRAMGGFQNFAISFTIISILAGCLTSYYIAFDQGGPIAVTWGWLLVGLMSTIVALAMAEIASAFPTAGGLYYWASKLGIAGLGLVHRMVQPHRADRRDGSDRLRPRDVRYGAIELLVRLPEHEGMDIFLLYIIFLVAALVINLLNVGITALLNTVSAYWHMAGVAFIVLVLVIVPDNHQSFSYVFTETVNATGFGGDRTGGFIFWYVFLTGLLMAQYTITGFDASAHMAEETNQASRLAAVGMYMAVVASVVFGFDPARRGDVRDPEHGRRDREHRLHRPVDLGRIDGPELGRGPALHLRRRAVLLRHGVDHVGVADALRVLARRRRPRVIGSGDRSAATGCPSAVGVSRSSSSRRDHDPDLLELPASATSSGRGSP